MPCRAAGSGWADAANATGPEPYTSSMEALADMEEVMGMSDRVLVMHERRIKGELQREQLSEQRIAQLMTGKVEGAAA